MQNQINTTVNALVDKVYVLSVKSFSERIAHINALMQQHNIQFEFVFEHDIPDISENLLKQTFSDTCTLSMAQKSLVLKHCQAWRHAIKHQYKQTLIFEDDVVLSKDFTLKLSKIMSAAEVLDNGYLIFLGGADTKVPDHFLLSNATLIENPIATAEAYISDLTAMQKRVAWLNDNQVSLPADHLISHIDANSNTKHYWPRHAIVEQGSITGIFNSHLDSHRQKHSQLFNISRYHWNKFQRHKLRFLIAYVRQYFR